VASAALFAAALFALNATGILTHSQHEVHANQSGVSSADIGVTL
jgi:hypothetical protein